MRGQGSFLDDINLPNQLYTVFLRSPHAHAKIRRIDTACGGEAPGVVAVYTGADYDADGLAMPKATMPRKKADGSPMFAPQRPVLVTDRVRYVGDPVAMVVATSAEPREGRQRADRRSITSRCPPSRRSAEAARPDAPRVWDENPDNISHLSSAETRRQTEAAFARAARSSKRRYVITRVHAQYMEPRVLIGTYDPGRTATRSTPTATIRTASATCWPIRSSRCRRAKCAWSPTMSAAVSAPRAGTMSRTGWCCGRRASSIAR